MSVTDAVYGSSSMGSVEVVQAVSVLFNAFSAPLFLAFTAMISFAVALGIKRLVLE